MGTELVDFGLLDVTQIAESYFGRTDRHISGKHLPEGRLIMERSKPENSPGITQGKDLIIRLSVVGREHHSHQGYIELIPKNNRSPADTGMPDSHSGGSQIYISLGRGGIIGVLQIIDKSTVEIAYGTCQQFQRMGNPELVVESVIPVNKAEKSIVIIHLVTGISHMCLEKVLGGDISIV